MNNKEKNFISAVIYCHNCEKSVGNFLSMIIDVMESNFNDSEIICVNDHSADSTVGEIKEASKTAKHTTVSVLNMSYFHGIESAMNAGVDLSIGDFVFEFDSTVADFDRSEIMNVYRKSLEGFDIVSASPNRKPTFSSTLFYKVFNKFSDLPGNLSTERFRILSRRVINRVNSLSRTVPYRKAVYANCGLKTINIQYSCISKSNAKNRNNGRYRRKLATDALLLFTDVGYAFSVTMTVIMMIVSASMAVYSVLIYFMSIPAEGWTTTVLFLSFAFFGLFGILSIVIKYLDIIVNLVFKRKSYNFESIEKLTK
ncbi:MAG: glycosyltransferase [Oscillospiraceae bacterium]|nr:glycosyltransferase [Oscillospiraceae bacterium]